MTKTRINFRLSDTTQDKLRALIEAGVTTNLTAGVNQAIEVLYEWRINGNAPTNVLMVVPDGKAQSIPICDDCTKSISALFEKE